MRMSLSGLSSAPVSSLNRSSPSAIFACASLSPCMSVNHSVDRPSRLSVGLTHVHVFQYVSLLVCTSVCMIGSLPACMSICFLYVCQPACVRISAYMCLYLYARFCIFVCRSVRVPSVRCVSQFVWFSSASLYICVSVCLDECRSIHPSTFLAFVWLRF